MLNAMRYGEMSPETAQEFRGLSRKVTYTDGIEPTEMYIYTVRAVSCCLLMYLNSQLCTPQRSRRGQSSAVGGTARAAAHLQGARYPRVQCEGIPRDQIRDGEAPR